MRWPRMTTRRWMVAVATLGVLIVFGPELLKFTPRGQRRLREAAEHARLAEQYRTGARFFQEDARKSERTLADLHRFNTWSQFPHEPSCLKEWEELVSGCREGADTMNQRATFHEEMKARYEAAARRIWELDPYIPPSID